MDAKTVKSRYKVIAFIWPSLFTYLFKDENGLGQWQKTLHLQCLLSLAMSLLIHSQESRPGLMTCWINQKRHAILYGFAKYADIFYSDMYPTIENSMTYDNHSKIPMFCYWNVVESVSIGLIRFIVHVTMIICNQPLLEKPFKHIFLHTFIYTLIIKYKHMIT